MMHSTPIPLGATVDDPLWTARFYDLANALILCGTKAKIVARATGLSQKQVSERYLRLTGNTPPLGRSGQADPKIYSRPSKSHGNGWVLQCAVFCGCYERLKESMTDSVDKAWLLYAAYDTYIRLTEKSVVDNPVRGAEQISINVAYDLVAHTQCLHPSLVLHRCKECGIRYLVLTTAAPSPRAAPPGPRASPPGPSPRA